MLAAHGIEQQRQILDIARHGALHRQIAIDLEGWAAGNAADARAHADDTAEARGVAQRAAHVGTVREPRHAGGKGDRGTARGAGGGPRNIPGVARRAEHLVEGVGAGAELRRVRFGVDYPAVVFETIDENIRARSDRVLEDRRALRGLYPLDIDEVLDR